VSTPTEQIRQWWSPYRCDTTKYERVAIPGITSTWNLLVAEEAVPAFETLADIMDAVPYTFDSSAGGTYNCRKIGGTNAWSLHAYAVAIDINPDRNKFGSPLRHDYPDEFIELVEEMETVNGKNVFDWGGRWNNPDAMHWQIDCKPSDIATGIKEWRMNYRGVINVPDKQWAKDVVDRGIDKWKTIRMDVEGNDWKKAQPEDGRIWTMLDRGFKTLHPGE